MWSNSSLTTRKLDRVSCRKEFWDCYWGTGKTNWPSGSLSNDDVDVNEKGKKAIGLDWQNNNFARASRFCVNFFAVRARLRRETEDVKTRQRLSVSFPEFWRSLLKFNSRKYCQHLTKWTRWNKRDKVWSRATSLFKWRFCSRRRRRCLSSLLTLWRVPGNDPSLYES